MALESAVSHEFSMKCFCTVVTRSHLRPAFVLARSLRSSGNTALLHLLVIDVDGPDELPPPPEGVVLHGLAEVEDRIPPLMPHYFDAFEMCNALKPFVVSLLFTQGAEAVIYLDSDLFVVGSFDPVWSALEKYPVLLTPHQLMPPPLGLKHTNEIEIVDQGIYNGGFTAWLRGEKSECVLNWMCKRFPVYGFNDRPAGMFVDQKLLPLVVEYFPEVVGVLREATLNIAFWNAHERDVTHDGSRYVIGVVPVVFFHLSGYRIDRPDVPCVYLPPGANQNIVEFAPWLSKVLADYLTLWEDIGEPCSAGEYKFSRFEGRVLTRGLRRILFKRGEISLRNPDVRRVLLVDRLRLIKRRLMAILKPVH